MKIRKASPTSCAVFLGSLSGLWIGTQLTLIGEIVLFLLIAILIGVQAKLFAKDQEIFIAEARESLARSFVVALFAIIFLAGFFTDYGWSRGAIVASFCGLAVSGSISLGIGRQFDLSLTSSFYVGGYLLAVARQLGIPFVPSAILGAVLGGGAAVFVSPFISRLRLEHQAAVTMAYILALKEAFSEWRYIGGATGLGLDSLQGFPIFLLAAVYLSITIFLFYAISKSSLGRDAVCERENPNALQMLGGSPEWVRTKLLWIQGAVAACGGVIYCAAIGYVSPRDFDVSGSLLILMIVMMGGLESIWTIVAGGVLISGCSENFIRFGSLNRFLLGVAFLVFTLLYSTGNRSGVPYEYLRPYRRR